MALKETIVYWTDNNNPPRKLSVPEERIDQDYPFPDFRQAANEVGWDLEEEAYIYKFKSRFRYSNSSGLTIFSRGPTGVFANVPLGSKVALADIIVTFRRQSIRSNVDYAVRARTSFTESFQSANFAYNLCTPSGQSNGTLIKKFVLTPVNGILDIISDITSTTNSVRVIAERTGGFVVYFPCSWYGDNGASKMDVTIEGQAIISTQNFEHAPEFKTDLELQYPLPGDERDELAEIFNPFTPVEPPEAAVYQGLQKTTIGTAQSSSTIFLPAGAVAGETIVIAIAANKNYPGTIPGWNRDRLYQSHDGTGGDYKPLEAPSMQLFSRVLDGSEGASVTINWEGDQKCVAWAFRFTGAQSSITSSTANGGLWRNNYVLSSALSALPTKLAVPDYPPVRHFKLGIIQKFESNSVEWNSGNSYEYFPLDTLDSEFVAGDEEFTVFLATGVRTQQRGPTATSIGPKLTFTDVDPFDVEGKFGIAHLTFAVYPGRD